MLGILVTLSMPCPGMGRAGNPCQPTRHSVVRSAMDSNQALEHEWNFLDRLTNRLTSILKSMICGR